MSDIVEVRVHGQVFKMRANAEDGHLQRVAEYVDGVLSQTSRSFGNQPGHRVAIMAAMQIADSLIQERASKDVGEVLRVETSRVEGILARMIAESDKLLAEE
ncbi:MAG: cell division protein ZapA [Magnetococcus sp. THC-1_WYH]